MKRAKKYNIIIYSSLLLAAILLVLGGRDYLKSQGETNGQVELEESSEDEKIERVEPAKKEPEPAELQSVDKASVIKKYLDSILDQIKKDKTITYKMIKTWGKYEIGEIEYQRTITTNYYEYKVDIIIPKADPKLPCPKNKELSTKESTVLTLYFDIVDSERANGYIVKNIDIIEE